RRDPRILWNEHRVMEARVRRLAASVCTWTWSLSNLVSLPAARGEVSPAADLERRLSRIDLGEEVRIQLHGGHIVAGAVGGLSGDWKAEGDYATRYERWAVSRPWLNAPRLGDALTLPMVSGDTVSGSFAGLAVARWLLQSGDPCFLVAVRIDQIAAMGARGSDS